jgi:hypothetical protein
MFCLSLINMLEYSSQATLMPNIIMLNILIKDETFVILINCIVSEMHAHVIHIEVVRAIVLLRCKSR